MADVLEKDCIRYLRCAILLNAIVASMERRRFVSPQLNKETSHQSDTFDQHV